MESGEALRRGLVNQVVASDELRLGPDARVDAGPQNAGLYHDKQWLNRTLRDRGGGHQGIRGLHDGIP